MEQEGQKQGEDEHLEKGEISLSRDGPQSLPEYRGSERVVKVGEGLDPQP